MKKYICSKEQLLVLSGKGQCVAICESSSALIATLTKVGVALVEIGNDENFRFNIEWLLQRYVAQVSKESTHGIDTVVDATIETDYQADEFFREPNGGLCKKRLVIQDRKRKGSVSFCVADNAAFYVAPELFQEFVERLVDIVHVAACSQQ